MCSIALAMIKNMTDTDIANELKAAATSNRKLKEEHADGIAWPKWMSVGDRRLLQSPSLTPDVVVAADGSGNFKTITEAVARAPIHSSKRYIIKIKAGVYRENVDVPKKKTNIMFWGDGRTKTIITGSRNVADGSTTFHSATVGTYIHFHQFFVLTKFPSNLTFSSICPTMLINYFSFVFWSTIKKTMLASCVYGGASST